MGVSLWSYFKGHRALGVYAVYWLLVTTSENLE